MQSYFRKRLVLALKSAYSLFLMIGFEFSLPVSLSLTISIYNL